MGDIVNILPEVKFRQEQIEIICNYNYALNEEFDYLDNTDNSPSEEDIEKRNISTIGCNE